MSESAAEILNKLEIDPETDCVAAFKPGNGCAFYIPDGFTDLIKEGMPIPAYVMATFTFTRMLADADDPVVQAFTKQMMDRVMADLQIQH